MTREYDHYRTFFQHNRWSAHDLIGELLARGITKVEVELIDADWVVSWRERTPPNALMAAAQTPA